MSTRDRIIDATKKQLMKRRAAYRVDLLLQTERALKFAKHYLSETPASANINRNLEDNLRRMVERQFAAFGEVTNRDVACFIEAWIVSHEAAPVYHNFGNIKLGKPVKGVKFHRDLGYEG